RPALRARATDRITDSSLTGPVTRAQCWPPTVRPFARRPMPSRSGRQPTTGATSMSRTTRYANPLLVGFSALAIAVSAGIAHAAKPFLIPNSLVISSSTYDRTQGAVATLTAGTTVLPNSATATTLAVADGNYVTVWNNEGVDASFGV